MFSRTTKITETYTIFIILVLLLCVFNRKILENSLPLYLPVGGSKSATLADLSSLNDYRYPCTLFNDSPRNVCPLENIRANFNTAQKLLRKHKHAASRVCNRSEHCL